MAYPHFNLISLMYAEKGKKIIPSIVIFIVFQILAATLGQSILMTSDFWLCDLKMLSFIKVLY